MPALECGVECAAWTGQEPRGNEQLGSCGASMPIAERWGKAGARARSSLSPIVQWRPCVQALDGVLEREGGVEGSEGLPLLRAASGERMWLHVLQTTIVLAVSLFLQFHFLPLCSCLSLAAA
jgi:hypothetical protein